MQVVKINITSATAKQVKVEIINKIETKPTNTKQVEILLIINRDKTKQEENGCGRRRRKIFGTARDDV